jgi:hypothetical protein
VFKVSRALFFSEKSPREVVPREVVVVRKPTKPKKQKKLIDAKGLHKIKEGEKRMLKERFTLHSSDVTVTRQQQYERTEHNNNNKEEEEGERGRIETARSAGKRHPGVCEEANRAGDDGSSRKERRGEDVLTFGDTTVARVCKKCKLEVAPWEVNDGYDSRSRGGVDEGK